MNRNKIQILAVAASVLILLGAVIVLVQLGTVVSAQEEAVVEQSAVAGATSTLLQYQGRLSDPDTGEPVADGSYTMVLRLYDKPSGGTPLWLEAKDVPVQDGLFSTVLGDVAPLNQVLFDGRALWLGIKVGADPEAMPRQQILPVAYALGLLPGAVIDGDLTVNGHLQSPGIVTQYEMDDHIYGGMHNGRALAYGSINQQGDIYSASGNVSSKWNSEWDCYEITIDGHTYDQRYYVTTVTPIIGIANAWPLQGKLCVGIYDLELDAGDIKAKVLMTDFHFVTFKP